MAKVMSVNCGSSSVKFKLYEMPAEKCLARGILECIGLPNSRVKIKYGQQQEFKAEKPFPDHAAAIHELLHLLKKLAIITDYHEITGVGHRVVAGGEEFNKSVIINEDVMQKIDKLSAIAPLHNPNNLIGIREFKRILPNAVAVAVFDTAFHQTLPEENYIYSVPFEWYEKYGARRYGAHGTSHHYVAQKAAEYFDKPLAQLKLITCHLGAGASMCAIKDGKSFDTSMGFTPLTGLTMASRAGDVDVSLIDYVMKQEKITDPDEMTAILNKKSGLLGISGVSPDMRDVLQAEKQDNQRAHLAVEIFIRNIVRYLGQYTFEMGGLDGIVFTAGIGENSDEIRQRVCERLHFAGIKLDEQANQQNKEGIISMPDSPVKVLRIATNEELMIAREVEKLKAKSEH